MTGDYTRSATGSLEMGKLSSRSVPTGPGSRGGRWHEPEYRRAWYRAYKQTRPEYLEREAERKAKVRHGAKMRRDRALVESGSTFTEAILYLLQQDRDRTSARHVSLALGMSDHNVARWLSGRRTLSAEGVDAVIATYGMRRILRTWATLRSHGQSGDPAGTE